MTDDEWYALGHRYKILGPHGYVYARTAAEANDVQREFHSHHEEAPEVELLRPEPTLQDAVQASLRRRC